MKTVLAFGTFDILHPGHISYLKQARTHGDRLIVVVSRDDSVILLKGEPPYFDQRVRLAMIRALRAVDDAVLGLRGDHCAIIKRVRPDVLCLGYDHEVKPDQLRLDLEKEGIPSLRIVRAKSYLPSLYKSHLIKQRLAKR